MKLYFAPNTCALSLLNVLNELGLPFDLVLVDNKTKKTAYGRDFLTLNPNGYVPVLALADGQVLTEGPVITQFLADSKPDARLAPACGTFERVRLQECLNFISTEIHKTFSPMFNPDMPAAAKAIFTHKLEQRFAHVAKTLQQRDYLMGAAFGVADAYLFTVARWARGIDIDLQRWPALARFMARVEARPAVQAALASERQAKIAA